MDQVQEVAPFWLGIKVNKGKKAKRYMACLKPRKISQATKPHFLAILLRVSRTRGRAGGWLPWSLRRWRFEGSAIPVLQIPGILAVLLSTIEVE